MHLINSGDGAMLLGHLQSGWSPTSDKQWVTAQYSGNQVSAALCRVRGCVHIMQPKGQRGVAHHESLPADVAHG
jgi:hypothetical protein